MTTIFGHPGVVHVHLLQHITRQSFLKTMLFVVDLNNYFRKKNVPYLL